MRDDLGHVFHDRTSNCGCRVIRVVIHRIRWALHMPARLCTCHPRGQRTCQRADEPLPRDPLPDWQFFPRNHKKDGPLGAQPFGVAKVENALDGIISSDRRTWHGG
jgi:hypothetical protein